MRTPHETRPRSAIALLFASAIFLLGGCESSGPVLPLPPPGFLSAPDIDGFATLSGSGASPEALVLAYNEDAETGVIAKATADGDYTARIPASPGDDISYWFRDGVVDSAIQTATVPAP
jgi:hypothetical protein